MPFMRLCVIPDSVISTLTNDMNELNLLELDATEGETLVFGVNQFLNKFSLERNFEENFPRKKKKIIKKPPFSVLTMEFGVWSYEMSENGKKRAAMKLPEKHAKYQERKLKNRRYWSNECWDDDDGEFDDYWDDDDGDFDDYY